MKMTRAISGILPSLFTRIANIDENPHLEEIVIHSPNTSQIIVIRNNENPPLWKLMPKPNTIKFGVKKK